jgi:hypothetical protein
MSQRANIPKKPHKLRANAIVLDSIARNRIQNLH